MPHLVPSGEKTSRREDLAPTFSALAPGSHRVRRTLVGGSGVLENPKLEWMYQYREKLIDHEPR
jgi:hypothetical protein